MGIGLGRGEVGYEKGWEGELWLECKIKFKNKLIKINKLIKVFLIE